MRRYRLRDLGMILSFNFVFSDEELWVSYLLWICSLGRRVFMFEGVGGLGNRVSK